MNTLGAEFVNEENDRLRAELEDALDVENGAGPTALGMVVAERDALRAELRDITNALARPAPRGK